MSPVNVKLIPASITALDNYSYYYYNNYKWTVQYETEMEAKRQNV